MLWVALHCPTLPLDRIQRKLPEGLVPVLAVTQSSGPRRWICMAHPDAQKKGVHAGQPVAASLALYPQLVLVERDLADEHLALKEAALALLRFTPHVQIRQSGLLLDVGASVRLFGGVRSLVKKLIQTLVNLRLVPAVGVAPVAGAAWLMALNTPSGRVHTSRPAELTAQLDALPITHLEHGRQHGAIFEGIGCRTIGALRRLPRDGVARRFGAALLDELDCAYGLRADPQIWFSAPEKFETRMELAMRADTVPSLMPLAERLMMQLEGWLAVRHHALGSFTLILYHEAWRRSDPATTLLLIRLAQPSRDPLHLVGLLRERLSTLELSAPVVELGLTAEDISAASVPNEELFPTAQSHALTLNRLIEKLSARLGPTAVHRIRSHPDHRPEKAWLLCAPAQSPREKRAPPAAMRPVWLLQKAQPLGLRNHRPVFQSQLKLLAGPERIESGWWDDAFAARDYYIAQNEGGQLLWIYHEREIKGTENGWYLHGLFG